MYIYIYIYHHCVCVCVCVYALCGVIFGACLCSWCRRGCPEKTQHITRTVAPSGTFYSSVVTIVTERHIAAQNCDLADLLVVRSQAKRLKKE